MRAGLAGRPTWSPPSWRVGRLRCPSLSIRDRDQDGIRHLVPLLARSILRGSEGGTGACRLPNAWRPHTVAQHRRAPCSWRSARDGRLSTVGPASRSTSDTRSGRTASRGRSRRVRRRRQPRAVPVGRRVAPPLAPGALRRPGSTGRSAHPLGPCPPRDRHAPLRPARSAGAPLPEAEPAAERRRRPVHPRARTHRRPSGHGRGDAPSPRVPGRCADPRARRDGRLRIRLLRLGVLAVDRRQVTTAALGILLAVGSGWIGVALRRGTWEEAS